MGLCIIDMNNINWFYFTELLKNNPQARAIIGVGVK